MFFPLFSLLERKGGEGSSGLEFIPTGGDFSG